MTTDEQNKAIAEACGYRDWWPEFTSSLDAMHSAEQTLAPDMFITYVDVHLCDACRGEDKRWSPDTGWTPAMVHATAAQKAESFLRTLNLWID